MSNAESSLIRIGMAGGAPGAMMGAIHRRAMRLEGRYKLVAGALSSRPEKAKAAAAELGIASDRAYLDYQSMFEAEAKRDDGIEAVVIVTPNDLHVPIAKAALSQGLSVICDKPLGVTLEESESLKPVVENSSGELMMTYVYSGYALVHQAREMVMNGTLGEVHSVQANYLQGMMAEPLQGRGWREDPSRAGEGGTVADIGTHAYQLAAFVTGLTVNEISAQTRITLPDRKLIDYMNATLRYEGGALGVIIASQVAAGYDNGLTLRVSGTKGSLYFDQENPEQLWFYPLHDAPRMIKRNAAGTGDADRSVSLLGEGLPEGYNDAFAQLYREFADRFMARREGQEYSTRHITMPDVNTGIEGMKFIDRVLKSSAHNGGWVSFEN